MQQLIKNQLKKIFPSLPAKWNYFRRKTRDKFYAQMTPSQVFHYIYKNNRWKSPESVSGSGSEMGQTEQVRLHLSKIIQQYDIKSMLDIPCGDFRWMQHVPLNIPYLGADIVKDLIQQNQQKYGSEKRTFKHLDLILDPLPQVDLIFCRDCLVHLSFAHAKQALDNIKKSGAKYLLMTHFPEKKEANIDIPTGSWRALNFELAPFNFPAPIFQINERIESFGKYLSLWKIEQL